jgi:hypothetical protein
MFDVFIVEDDEAFCELLTHALLKTKKVHIVALRVVAKLLSVRFLSLNQR